MAKKAPNYDAFLKDFLNDLRNVFGMDVFSVYQYGITFEGRYDPAYEEINFLVVLCEDAMENLERAAPMVKRWAKKGLPMPLFLTRAYIESSLDSFPIEFLNIKLTSRHIYGVDFLDRLEIDRGALRLKCEEQVKSKLLHLRSGVLASWENKKELRRFLSLTVPTFVSLFRSLLLLTERTVPSDEKQIFRLCADAFQIDGRVFEKLVDIHAGKSMMGHASLQQLAKQLIKQVSRLSEYIDQWNMEKAKE